jgi:hypothetical protein
MAIAVASEIGGCTYGANREQGSTHLNGWELMAHWFRIHLLVQRSAHQLSHDHRHTEPVTKDRSRSAFFSRPQ